ncbi:MAG: PAS domain-containing sensor histidine kinase [Bacteroidota bacterium]
MSPKKSADSNSNKDSNNLTNNLSKQIINNVELEAFFKQSLDGFFFMALDTPINWEDKSKKDEAFHKFFYEQRITKANQAFLDQYLAQENDIIGLTPADFFVHDLTQGIDVCKKILDLGQTTIITEERKLDGTQMLVEAEYFLFKNENNYVTGLFGIQRDITEKRKVELELINKENSYRTLFNTNPHPMFIYDVNTLRFLAVNDSACSYYGYTAEEFFRMTLKDISPKEDWTKIEEIISRVKKEKKFAYTQYWRHIKKDGSTIFVDLRAQSIFHEGKEARICVATDVTEAKQIQDTLRNSEESFRGLFNSVYNAIYIQDELGVFIDVNAGAEKMYGYNREYFIGKTPEFLSAPNLNDLQQVAKYIEAAFAGNGPASFEFWGKRKNGDIFPKHVSISKGKYFGQDVIIAVASDITVRKSYEQSLAASENNFKAVFKNISDAVLIHDFQGNIIEANDRAVELYEVSRQQLEHSNVRDLTADTANQLLKLSDLWENTKKETSLHFEWRAKKPISGLTFDVEVSLRKSIWTGKEVIIAIIRDITERKRNEIELRIREESYRELFDSMIDAIYILDKDGYFVDVNSGAEKMYGYLRKELIGKTPAYLSPEGMNDMEKVAGYLRETFSTGKVHQFDFYGLRKNGEVFPKNVIINRGKYYGQVVIIAIGRDISESKKNEQKIIESEERFRRIYEDSPIGIYRSTPKGEILIANPALVKMLGYSTLEELKKLDIDKEFYAADTTRKDFLGELEMKGRLTGNEYSLRKKGGEIIHIRENARVVKDSSGNTLYYEGTIEDISDRKIAEQNLIKSESKLRETNAAKDKFFSIIAHDLRSPFQGLLGISAILNDEEELSLEERIKYASKLHEGLKNQFSLLEDLLTWSRIQRGAMEFKPEKNVPQLDIKEILVPFKTAIEKKNIIFNFICNEKISAVYDKNMFNTVVRNLVSNAIKFTRENGSIILKVSQTEKDLLVSVTDNGIGIPKEDLPKLFQIESHFVRRGTRDESGSGLGLTLCKEFVERHKGKLWVESIENSGSTFSFSIPKN